VSAAVGLIGLAVMGQNLALNLAEHGHPIAVFNRTSRVTDDFIAANRESYPVQGAASLAQLVKLVERPRRLILMIKAGSAVDDLLAELLDLVSEGDVVIDGGNSLFTDTERRQRLAADRGVAYVGAGISGGEEGARHGPSIMAGGNEHAWPLIAEMLQGIAARTPVGEACCEWLGPGGSGHFVKMVHNGIEYGDMQIIAEAFHLMQAAGMMAPEMAEAFRGFANGRLSSFLIDITAQILEKLDDDGTPLIHRVLDAAAQKGTGKWTVQSSLELGQPATLIAEAVYARMVSSFKEQRVTASALLSGPSGDVDVDLADLESALYGSKIVSYAQGFMLLAAASEEYRWGLELAKVSPLWRAGCIIRAAFLDDITRAFRNDPKLPNLMLDPYFTDALADAQTGWRRVVAGAVSGGIPVPAYSSALAFYDSYRSEHLPANLIQAQRDLFGAHTYERTDRPRGEFFHTNWT
jgi:6-phosphogluconate dehydrogenase